MKKKSLQAFITGGRGYIFRRESNSLSRYLTLHSPKSQQSIRQCRSFANDNEASAHK